MRFYLRWKKRIKNVLLLFKSSDGHVSFVEIHRTHDNIEAELIKGILENKAIDTILKSHVVRFLYPFTVDGLGEVRILVPEDRLEAARRIIKENELISKRKIYRVK